MRRLWNAPARSGVRMGTQSCWPPKHGSFRSPVLPPLRCGYSRNGSPRFMDAGQTSPEEGSDPSKVTWQARPGWSLGPLPEIISIPSALMQWPAMRGGVAEREDEAGDSKDLGLVYWEKQEAWLAMQRFKLFRGQPQSPSLATLPSQHALRSVCSQPAAAPGGPMGQKATF